MLTKVIAQTGGADSEAQALKNRILGSSDVEYSSATVYYVSQNGDDSCSGESRESAFRSVHSVDKLDLNPGDSVLFERGSVFRINEMLWLKPFVHYGAYGVGEKPLILGSIKDFADPSIWKKTEEDTIWVTKLKGEQRASLMTLNGDEYFGNWCFLKKEMASDGDFFHDNSIGLFYLYCAKGNPGEVFNRIEIATTGIGMRASFIDGMSIDNIAFKYFAQGAFLFGECNNISVTNCVMGWQGGKIFEMRGDKPLRYGNAAEFWYQCRNITVENNFIYQIYDAAVTFQGYGDGGPIFENIRFDNNLIEYCSMNIEYWAGKPEDKVPPHIDGISYSGNIIRFCGYGFGGKERFDKEDQALLLGWNRRYTDINNFVIKENILDCSKGYYIFMFGPAEQEGITLEGNSYYQKYSDENFDIICGKETKAGNEAEFDKAIRLFDSNPKLTVFLK